MHMLILIPKIATFPTAYFLRFNFYIIVGYFNTGGHPSMVFHFPSKELRVLFSRAIFFSIFMEVNRSCKYTCSVGMKFFNLQVYI